MWNRRKDEEFALKPASAPPTSSALAKEGNPYVYTSRTNQRASF